jgi:FG-GAP-like repeat/Kre9/KNH-like N-terminal Ig-like domain
MKKLLFFVFLFVACFLFVNNEFQLTTASAQTENNARRSADANDLLLADTIKRLTNRSTEGLVQKREVSGKGFSIDLDDRFQNVMLSKIDTDGEPVAACVTSVEEANAFFGKNLETGDLISSNLYQKDDTATVAARHGMSEEEFNFYKKLIEESQARLAARPEAATINIVNGDGAGEGFNDATIVAPEGGNNGTTRGEQRTNLFNFAAAIWGAFLDTNVSINVNSQFNSLSPCTTSGGVLGSAGTTTIFRDFSAAEYTGTWYHVALANKRQGSDLNGATAEINARFNSDVDNGCLGAGTRFYYGLNNTTPGGRINLLVVLLHEMGHGLGFSSFANGSTGTLNSGFPDVYTRNMYDRTTGKYWHEMTDAERMTSALNAGNVLWDGPNVRNASGNLTAGREASTGRVQLFTPSTFQQGSSVSHFDSAVFTNVLMEPNINTGLPIDLDLTRQQMRDIGWYRDTNVDMIPDTITSVTPTGTSVVIGSTATITWTNTGEFSRNVTIELSTNGGTTYPTVIASNVANNGSYTFTVPNTPTTQARVRVREYNFVEPAGFSAANFTIGTTTAPTARAAFDYDGDGKTDVSIFRPASGEWWINRSLSGSVAFQFGAGTDKIVPADFTGDGKTDVAIFRPASGEWFVMRSENQSFYSFPFGANGDIPAPADFDGDGKADAAVFRPSTATWYIMKSTGGTTIQAFGQNGDMPVVADYDGDSKADIAIYRVASGEWWINRSAAGLIAFQFGNSADKTVQGDYTGDGKADVAIFRPSTREWFVLRSENQSYYSAPFGANGDVPTPGDYDGDGKTDFAVFRASEANWYLQRSTAGFTAQQFGSSTDLPTPNAFVR